MPPVPQQCLPELLERVGEDILAKIEEGWAPAAVLPGQANPERLDGSTTLATLRRRCANGPTTCRDR